MDKTRDEILEEDRVCREKYPRAYDELLALLFRHDPIGINFVSNTDEYASEVRTILPRLSCCHSADDVLTVVHEEYTNWFGDVAGTRERYEPVATDVWKLWRHHLNH